MNANLIAIASGKGGVGKTWFAITMAHLMARSGRRILLLDGDIGLANVDVQLGLTPAKDLSGVLEGRYALADAITPYAPGGFDVLAGRSGSASLATLPAGKLQMLCDQLPELARNYDRVLVDLSAGIEQNVQTLANLCGRCVVVVTDEPTSLTDAYAFIKVTAAHKPAPEMSIVVNQAATQKEGEATHKALLKACMSFLNLTPPLLGIIRRDTKVKDSIRAQSSLIIRAPQTTAATDAAVIAIKLMQN